MKKTGDDSLKKELDKGNNFVDYFVVIGINKDLTFDDFLYENDLETLNLSGKFTPEIQSKFPPFDKTTISIDENMIRHCFPNGYKLKESKTSPNPESFCLILDNNYFSINYPQKYISCLIFYESLASYKKLYDKYNSENNEAYFANRNENDLYNSTSTKVIEFNDANLKRIDSFTSLNTVFTVQNTVNLQTTQTLTSTNRLENSIKTISTNSNYFSSNLYNSAKYKNIWVPKCICLVSVFPFFVEFAKILKTIYKFSKNPKLKKPIERIIENLVIEVPVPPRGFYSVEYHLFNEKYVITQTAMNQLPFLSIEFEKIFINFKIEQILEIYKHFLLETRIIFFSSDLSNLTPIIQGFLSLIYPFKYPFQFVTILPEENFNFLESVSPYIIGINLKYNHNFFYKNNLDVENMTILIVDIDHRKLDLISPNLNKMIQQSQKNKFMAEEFPDLPRHYKAKLSSKITDYIKKIKSDSKKEDRDNFSLTIRNLFFQFIVNILQNYNKYLNTDYYTQNEFSSPSINNLFKAEEFIYQQDYYDRPFYRKLINDTQIFVEFILKRMIPKDSNEKLEILFFDENLMEKNSRRLFGKKVFTPFIHSTLYDIKHTYSVQKHRGFSEEEFSHFKDSSENRKQALKYGQEIIVNNNELLINYHVFPCLMTEIFFKNSPKAYFLPPNLSEDLDAINIDMVSKSHLGTVSMQRCEMENYINLCWIQLWAMTFWYHDEEEKRYRFQQLLNVLDIVINHEMEIFNLLFETLSKHGEDVMVLKLYERLVYYKLNPSYTICMTVNKLVDKKDLLGKLGVVSINSYVERYDFKRVYDENKFRKRSFKTKYDLNILNGDVQFYTWDTCIECQTSLNLEKMARDFAHMKRDILWAECVNCGTGLLPKIAVRFGRELNNLGNIKFNTSSYEGFVLYSPFHLKYNYNNGLLKEFGLKLDVDSFKYRFNAIFWDSIWYFKIKNLPIDFMLPYENTLDITNLQKLCNIKINRVPKIIKNEEKINSGNDEIVCNSKLVGNSYTKNELGVNKYNEKLLTEETISYVYLKSVKNKDEIKNEEVINYVENNTTKLKLSLEKTNDISFKIKSCKNLTAVTIKNEETEKGNLIMKNGNSMTDVKQSLTFQVMYASETNQDNINIATEQSMQEERENKSNEYLESSKSIRYSSEKETNKITEDESMQRETEYLITDRSYINPSALVDNTIILDSTKILDTESECDTSFKIDLCLLPPTNSSSGSILNSSNQRRTLPFKKLETIKEDTGEFLKLEKHSNSNFNKFDTQAKFSETYKSNCKRTSSLEETGCEYTELENVYKTYHSDDENRDEIDKDRTPIKSLASLSDRNILDIFKRDYLKTVRKNSLDPGIFKKGKLSLKDLFSSIEVDHELN